MLQKASCKITVAVIFFILLAFCDKAQAATIYANYSTGNDSTGDGSVGTPFKTFTKAYASSTDGDILDLTGTFNWSNADETGDGSNGFIVDKNLTINGHGSDQTILQAASAYGSANRRIFYVSSTRSLSLNSLTVRYGYSSGGATYTGGGCIYSASSSTLSINYSEITGCNAYYSSGAAIVALSTTTISNSTIYSNIIDPNVYTVYGAGIYLSASDKTMNITNTTFYSNTVTWSSSGSGYGGALYINAGTANITNCTIYNNGSWAYGGGIYLKNVATAILNLRNSIVAGNTSSGSTHDNIYKNSSATINNGGYNIIGNSTNYTSSTGDWLDSGSGTATDGVYGLYGGSATGTLNIDTQATYNDNSYKTKTYGLLSGSIAINNATTTAHNSIDIPTVD